MKEKTKAILSSWQVGGSSENNKNNSGFVPKNMRGKSALPKPKFSKGVSKNMQDPNGDYLWLLSGSR